MQCCVSCRNRVLCVVCQVTLGECKIALVHEKLREILPFFFLFSLLNVPTALVIISSRYRLERMGLREMDKFIEETATPFFFSLFFAGKLWSSLPSDDQRTRGKKKSAAAVDPCLPCVLSLTLVALAVVQVFGAKILPPFARSKFPRYFGILSNLFRLLLSIHPSIHRARLYPSPLALPPYGNAAAG